jgi:hypothetical protein
VDDPCPKAAADTFREAPWTADDLRIPLRQFLVQQAFDMAEAEGAPHVAFLSLDDSLTDKDNGSRRLQMVDWFFDHAHSWPGRPIYTKANVYVLGFRVIITKSRNSNFGLLRSCPHNVCLHQGFPHLPVGV